MSWFSYCAYNWSAVLLACAFATLGIPIGLWIGIKFAKCTKDDEVAHE